MTPLVLVLALSLAVLVLCRSRRMAAVGIIAAVCYLTEGQALNVAGFHFTPIRLVLLAGLIRVVARRESSQLRFNTIDRSVIAYAFGILIISTLRVGTAEELVYRIGCIYNILLAYFVFRCLLRDERDYREVLVRVAFLITPFVLLVLLESLTNRNLFSALGGVWESSMVRDGHVRSEGSFRSPITAGAFGATFAMLFASMWFAGARTRPVLVGVVASLLIVICAHSSGPFLGLTLGLLAFGCWPVRWHTPKICWGIVAVLVGLQLVMNAPVWFLIGRISDLVGGGGYHRAYLIDQFVSRFSSWWLAGVSDTSDWFPYQLSNGEGDMTNRFVADGIDGGLIGLIVSVALVVRCFQRLGVAMKAKRENEPATERMLWGLGSTLVGSIGILFSVTYFDQMQVIWYFLLACIAGVDVRKSASTQAALYRNDDGAGRTGILALQK